MLERTQNNFLVILLMFSGRVDPVNFVKLQKWQRLNVKLLPLFQFSGNLLNFQNEHNKHKNACTELKLG